MAKTRDTIDTVKLLAEISHSEKTRVVAASMTNLTAEEERLQLLEGYLQDYVQAGKVRASGLDASIVRARHEFIEALGRAIADQEARIENLRKRLEADVGAWRRTRAKANAVDRLVDRRTARERQRDARREQAKLDETGSRRRLNGPGES